MKLLLGMTTMTALLILYIYIDTMMENKRSKVLKANHKSFNNIPEQDIEVFNGQVYVKVLDHIEYKQFKRRIKDNKQLRGKVGRRSETKKKQ